jgi:hypothetical protein
MIRIERGKEVAPGTWEYFIPSLLLFGTSRQPLLDACRQIKRALGPTKSAGERAGVYRAGKSQSDISCLVLKGAALTVSEPTNGKIKFAKFQEFDSSIFGTNEAPTISAPPRARSTNSTHEPAPGRPVERATPVTGKVTGAGIGTANL